MMSGIFLAASLRKIILACALLLLVKSPLRGDDWPQWRGANRDGVWRETGILEAIPAGGLPVRWRARVALGYSGPVVAGGRVVVTDRQRAPEVERVLCFDESTGKPLWTHSYPCNYETMEYGNGPRASPTVHEGKVYTLGTQGHVTCLDVTTGAVAWKTDLVQEHGARVPQYGASAAPLVEGDLVILCTGGPDGTTVIAFNRHTGELRWKALEDRPAYSAPIAITAGGHRQVIVWTADTVAALESPTGKVLWQIPYKATFDPAQAVASPVVHQDSLLFLGAWNRGSLMLKLDASQPAASVLWKTRSLPTTTMSTPVFQDKHYFYAVQGDGRLCCLEAASGNEVWGTREPTSARLGHAHLTPNGDRVFIFNQKGHLVLARLTPAGYQELGRCMLVEPTAGYRAADRVTWAHPAYANKHVFARNDRELVCASLAADQLVAADSAKPEPALSSRALAGAAPEDTIAMALAFSPNGQNLALGSGWGTVKVLEAATGKEVQTPKQHNDWVCSVAFSPDGKLVVSAGGSEFTPARNGGMTSGQIKVWDLAAKAELGQLEGHTSKVFSAAFSPDSTTLATGSADKTVRLWDMQSRTERAVLRGHANAVSAVAFSKDGSLLVSASYDRTVKLWDPVTGMERGSLPAHDEEILAVAISPDGKTIATGSADWTARLWSVETKDQHAILSGHRGAVHAIAFSSNGQSLFTGSGDETIKLWSVESKSERMTLRGHKSGVSGIALSPSDTTLASAGMDDSVRLWDLTPLK